MKSSLLILNLARDNRGAAMIEFGLLIVPLMAMIMAAGELGYRTYVKAQLQGSLNDVARSVVVEKPGISGTGTVEQRIETAVKDRMKPLLQSGSWSFSIENYTSFNAIDKPEPLVTDKNGNGRYDKDDCWVDTRDNKKFDSDGGRTGLGGADDVVVYDVRLTANNLFPVMGFFRAGPTFVTQATALVRTQPYAKQREPEVICG